MNKKLSLRYMSLFLLVHLSGCFGSSPSVHYYALSSLNREQSKDEALISGERVIGVAPVTIPEYLNRSGMVRLKSENEIEVSEIELWVEPLSDAITRNLVENLSLTCGCKKLSFQPMSESGASDAKLVIDFDRFEKADGKVVLRARWTLREYGNSDKTAQRLSIYDESLTNTSANEEARGLSILLQKFAQEICEQASK